MSFPSASPYGKLSHSNIQAPPVVAELEAIFRELPDEELLTKLIGPRRRGPKGYNPTILWHCYVAYYYLGLESVSALIRQLHDNPFIAKACGIGSPEEIPSQPTFSRFGTKLAKSKLALAVKNVLRNLTRRLYDAFPGFGKSVAIDSTDIKAWSNGGKRRKGKVSDPDAGWIVKVNTEGNKKYVWGYKVHILADTAWELPIAIDVTAGNVADVKRASPLLRQARFTTNKFHPDYVVCDAGYSSDPLRQHINRQYRAEPIIDPNPSHKKATARTVKTPEWKAIYNRRVSIERLNGRLKAHRKLNSVRTRGRFKVRVHAMLSIIMCQAQALATGCRASVRKIA
jgi:IS5 family transposase